MIKISTRCQIEFKVGTERRTVYRHSDGYPDGVIPDLKEFLKWDAGRNEDIEYCTANFIYWSKKQNEEYCTHTGFGICENDDFHGDIEYFYEVVVDGVITINAYEVMARKDYNKPVTRKDFKLIKSEKV